MANSKKRRGAATVPAPQPAAIARPALPEGFEVFVDNDGSELVRPTPARAVADLLCMLESLAPWERYPDDENQWTGSQISARAAPWPGYIRTTGRDQHERVDAEDPGDDDRTDDSARSPFRYRLRHPAEVARERLTAEWERRTGRKRARREVHGVTVQSEPVIRRSPIDERLELVWGLRTGFRVFVPQAIAAVFAVGGNAAPLRELERDPELCSDTVTKAVLELQRVIPKPADPGPPEEPIPDLGVDEEKILVPSVRASSRLQFVPSRFRRDGAGSFRWDWHYVVARFGAVVQPKISWPQLPTRLPDDPSIESPNVPVRVQPPQRTITSLGDLS
ncbi:MAG TPA: hypothetical protein VFD82_02035 [Planctomycetota bacterium]|nr:hypothetical protein [Planctomycetota bacterium]